MLVIVMLHCVFLHDLLLGYVSMIISLFLQIPWAIPFRAFMTIPKGLRVGPSNIPGAGFGVISETFIPAFTWLNEYEGEIVPQNRPDDISWYTWTVCINFNYTTQFSDVIIH